MKCDPGRMRPLRYHYLWLFSSVILVGFVLYTTLMPGIAGPVMLNDKMAHALAFGILMAWFSGIFELRFSPRIALALLCFGILIEFLQLQLHYRSAELKDVLADLIGINIGWVLATIGLHRWAITLESWVAPNPS